MLTTTAVHDRNLDRAVGELLQNTRRLAASGFAIVAREALGLLLQPGPWRLPAHGLLVQQLQQLLPAVSLLTSEPSPTVGDQASIPLAELPDWAVRVARKRLRSLAGKGAAQQRAAGADWSPVFLSTLADRQGGSGDAWPHLAFSRFCADAEFVLKARIGERFGVSNAIVDMPSTEELQALGLPSGELVLLLAQLEGAGRINVAPAANAVDTADIARATANYLRATNVDGGYLSRNIFLASWLQLVEEGRDADAVEVATMWLAHDEDAAASMLDFAPVTSVGRFLGAAKLAPALQIDGQGAHGWLAQVRSRTMSESPAPMSCDPPAAPRLSRAGFLALLQGTPLEALEWLQVPVPGSDERAWVASVPVEARKELWHRARALSERTGHWPVITTLGSALNEPPDVAQLGEDLFMRLPYQDGPLRDDVSPRSFINTSRELDIDAFLAQLAEPDAPLEENDQLQVWRDELKVLGVFPEGFEQAWAAAPATACVSSGGSQTRRLRTDRWTLSAGGGRTSSPTMPGSCCSPPRTARTCWPTCIGSESSEAAQTGSSR